MEILVILMKANKKDSRGAVLPLVGLLLFVFIGIAALAIDIGYRSLAKNELQNVADSAALAGAGYVGSVYLSDTYKDLTPSLQQVYTFTRTDIVDVVRDAGLKNKAAGVSISINDSASDVVIGKWDPVSKSVNPVTLVVPDAVYVKTRRDDQANTPIQTFFAKIFNVDAMAETKEAAAALSGPSWVAEGELILPFGLSERLFPNDCGDVVAFSPTPSSCAGWHNFFDSHDASAIGEKAYEFIKSDTCEYCDINNGLVNGAQWLENNFSVQGQIDPANKNMVPTPPVSAGDDFDFSGGNISTLFNGQYLGPDYDGNIGTPYQSGNPIDVKLAKNPAPFTALFDYFRYRDNDGDNSVWTASVPVYKDDSSVDCSGTGSNPQNLTEIVGFAKIVVMRPNPPPATNIDVHVDCNISIIEGRSGGGTYGNLLGSIPALVK